jgi:hypothetical protein
MKRACWRFLSAGKWLLKILINLLFHGALDYLPLQPQAMHVARLIWAFSQKPH